MRSTTQVQIDTLLKLQSIEIERNGLNSMLSGVPQKLQALDTKLKTFEQRFTEEQTRLDELKKKYRQREMDVEMNRGRIKKSQEKLRSVKNNKEYQSILKEIDDIEAINSKIEDEMIEYLEQMEAVENFLLSRKDEFEELKEHVKSEKASIQEEYERGKKRLMELNTEWDKISKQVEPGLLKTYLNIRDKRGTAVAAVNDSVCRGCHLNIPPQMYNELQRCDSLRFCPHCQRIIYWKAS
ncbi:MAG: hypothetical protein JRH18_04545 [Deltaproteobacteria bacterium]|nr:hypothetical protein [Deltaproteobacteria bacterium]MBW1992829.1 hypothetical protein [Deltaproteobacteria bacterium]MBW2150915.1 hypothetical protein [Deltaproteobacteria bacterium]